MRPFKGLKEPYLIFKPGEPGAAYCAQQSKAMRARTKSHVLAGEPKD